MDPDLVLLLNGIVSGLLLGGLYAAAACGLAVSFGMLDIVNIAHPALMVAGGFLRGADRHRARPGPAAGRGAAGAALLRCWGSASTPSTTTSSNAGGTRRCRASPSSSG